MAVPNMMCEMNVVISTNVCNPLAVYAALQATVSPSVHYDLVPLQRGCSGSYHEAQVLAHEVHVNVREEGESAEEGLLSPQVSAVSLQYENSTN